MDKCVTILLVGIGGFGYYYLNGLLDAKNSHNFKIVGAVDIKAESCYRISEIREKGIPIFNSIDNFYASHSADLAIISTPIHFHCRQTCYALEHGSNVLCEKPAAATIQDVEKMMKARNAAGKFVAIGYQWSYSEAFLKLKQDVMSGILGKPKRLKTIVLWPRNDEYFSRGWAGKKFDDKGNPIFDSIAHNAASHYLHNMFHILGDSIDTGAYPETVTAELYRANKIENFDTIALRAFTDKGTELVFIGTHATNNPTGPDFHFEFENATVSFSYKNANEFYDKNDTDVEHDIKAIFKDGSVKSYGNPYKDEYAKIQAAIKAAREGAPIPCGLEASAPQVLCINGVQNSMREITNFPTELVCHDESLWENKSGYRVEGLSNILKECYKNWLLPAEMQVPWAKAGKMADLKSY